ncbi:MAG: hypothetical protein K8R88_09885 [Armatimonadetes bacterium]|nr:hypothetical protein [Armatimonadota bacterium]
MESIMNSAFENLLPWLKSEATVDPFLADQLLIPAAFAEEPSIFTTSNVTARLQTMAWVIKEFLPIHITILGREGEPGTIKVSR